jgi:hypothetical protein
MLSPMYLAASRTSFVSTTGAIVFSNFNSYEKLAAELPFLKSFHRLIFPHRWPETTGPVCVRSCNYLTVRRKRPFVRKLQPAGEKQKSGRKL